MFSSEELRLRTLLRAAELCGGGDRLAALLGISHTKLALMLNGGAVPEHVFLGCVDLLTARDVGELYERQTSGPKQSTDGQEA